MQQPRGAFAKRRALAQKRLSGDGRSERQEEGDAFVEAPEPLKYTAQHAWVRVSGKQATIGLTDFGQNELGMIVFIELPLFGDRLTAGEPYGSVETIESAADLPAPVTGKVVRVNEALGQEPFHLNAFPYTSGWIAVIEMTDPAEADRLWSSRQYAEVYGDDRK